MTEVSYVTAGFEEKFAAFKGKQILLHGSREYARAIVERFDPLFHFAGIVSFDPVGSPSFFGVPVFRQEEIPDLRPDLIILTERVKYAEAAYCALRRICRQNGIALWNMYGLDEIRLHREAEKPAPESLAEWQELCAPYDRVVFEAMDTLIHFPLTGEKPMMKQTHRSLIAWLREQGKPVGFSLRKSFSEETQIEALQAFGLVEDAPTELIRRRGEDLSFRALRQAHPGEKILYIGNGLVNEFILPRCYGIDTRRVGERWDTSCVVPEKEEPIRRPYSPDRRRQIQAEIRAHTYISFDVFDTLLVRKTLLPTDVFFLTERRAAEAGCKAEGFAAARIHAEQEIPCADLDGIYEALEDRFDWSEETARRIRDMELDVERDVLSPRGEVVELLRFARQEGKRVMLTSDMYLPEPVLRGLLAENGITDYDRLLVSCDYKKAKQTGLYDELIAQCGGAPEEILHIGDNPAADGAACAAANIPSIVLPSPLELARERGWGASLRSARTLTERCLVGLAVAELFRDPFQDPNLYERPAEERLWRYGTGAVGPLAAGHMTWLLEKLRENDYDGVLFLARDGYLPIAIYKQLQERMELPPPIYYYANRHAAFLCVADSAEQADYITDLGRQKGLSAREALKNIYRVPDEELLPQEAGETTTDYIDRHMSVIRRIAEGSREGFRRYSRRCGMRAGGKYAVVDFVAAGTIQTYLQQFLPFRLKGYYFGSYSPTSKGKSDIEYYLQGNNKAFLNSYIEMESYLTSPEPPQDCMQADGTAVFDEEVRSPRELQEFRMVFDAALSFAEEFFRLFYREGETISAAMVEEMYAAEGYHWVQQQIYDDWFRVPISRKTP